MDTEQQKTWVKMTQSTRVSPLCHHCIISLTTQMVSRRSECGRLILSCGKSPLKTSAAESKKPAAAAKTHLTGCGDRWCTAVQTLFFFNLCLFHFVFHSGLQILGSGRTMRIVMFCLFYFFFSIGLSVSWVSGITQLYDRHVFYFPDKIKVR